MMHSHGIMFHHFHNDGLYFTRSQGSISASTFYNILVKLREKGLVFRNPDEWRVLLRSNKLKPNDICVTFDDALKCQFDVARPVMDSLGIKAFWFIYTSPMQGVLERLEIYRYFRFNYFENIESFYYNFFVFLEERQDELGMDIEQEDKKFIATRYIEEHLFYTPSDRRFRYFRDVVLGPEKYCSVMDAMLSEHEFDEARCAAILWMTKDDIKELASTGHAVGLHSHTHPTNLKALTRVQQEAEYRRNFDIISNATGSVPWSVSYPCGSYNRDTDSIMKSLGINCGFDATMHPYSNSLHIPRIDHAYLIADAVESK